MVSTIHTPDTFLVQASGAVPPAILIQWTNNDPNVKHLQQSNNISVPENQLTIAPYIPALPITDYATGQLTKLYGTTAWLGYVQQPAIFSTNASTVIQAGNGNGNNSLSGEGIVAVIDTGVDPTNVLLAPVLVPGYDFTQNVAGSASELGDVNQSTGHILFQSTGHILFGYTAVQLTPSTSPILDSATAASLAGATIPNDFGHGTMVAGLIHLIAPTAQIIDRKSVV